MAVNGNFAGGFGQGFMQVWQAKQEKERADKVAKLQGQLLELQLKSQQGQNDAMQKVREMGSGSKQIGGRDVPVFHQPQVDADGLGELKRGGGLTSILSDPEGQMAALEARLVGAKDLMPSQARKPSALAIMEAMGMDPASPEGRKLLEANLAGGSEELRNQIDALKVQQSQFNLQSARDELTNKNKAKDQGQQRGTFRLKGMLNTSSEAVDLANSLRGTPLEPGSPIAGQARDIQALVAAGGGALGADTKDLEQLIANRDRLEKLYGVILNDRIQAAIASGQQMTDASRAQLASISPSLEKRSEANRLLLADFLEEELGNADISEAPIPASEREKIEKFIKEARATGVSENQPIVDVVGSAEAVSKMTMDQIKELGTKASELPDDILRALDRRWRELNGD